MQIRHHKEFQSDVSSVCPFVRETEGIIHVTVTYLVAKPLIWREAEGDLVVIKTSI